MKDDLDGYINELTIEKNKRLFEILEQTNKYLM